LLVKALQDGIDHGRFAAGSATGNSNYERLITLAAQFAGAAQEWRALHAASAELNNFSAC
jgi:hypothetical protein